MNHNLLFHFLLGIKIICIFFIITHVTMNTLTNNLQGLSSLPKIFHSILLDYSPEMLHQFIFLLSVLFSPYLFLSLQSVLEEEDNSFLLQSELCNYGA
jgi:hypothetical protein